MSGQGPTVCSGQGWARGAGNRTHKACNGDSRDQDWTFPGYKPGYVRFSIFKNSVTFSSISLILLAVLLQFLDLL